MPLRCLWILPIALLLASQTASAATASDTPWSIRVGVFEHSLAIPFTTVVGNSFSPGGLLGVDLVLTRGSWWTAYAGADVTYHHHAYVTQAVHILPGVGIRVRPWQGVFADAGLDAGLALTGYSQPGRRYGSRDDPADTSIGLVPQFVAKLHLAVGYDLRAGFDVPVAFYLQYSGLAEVPFGSLPLGGHTELMLGSRISFAVFGGTP